MKGKKTREPEIADPIYDPLRSRTVDYIILGLGVFLFVLSAILLARVLSNVDEFAVEKGHENIQAYCEIPLTCDDR